MASINYTTAPVSPGDITQDHGSKVEIAVLALTAFSTVATLIFLVTRLCCRYVIPEGWRLSLIFQDLANLLLGTGLVFFVAYMGTGFHELCSAAGFFLLAGFLDCACMLALAVVSLLFLQNPGKLGQLSTFRKSWIALFVVPEKVLVFVLSVVPVIPMDYFDTDSPFPVACFPVRQEGGKGAAFGAILFFMLWVLEILGLILSVACAFRLWKSNNSRIHASSPNLWQTEKIGQGRGLQKMVMLEQLLLLVVTLILTVVVYTNSADDFPPQWVVMIAVAVVTLLHACMCGVQLVMWSSACCLQSQQKSKEPYQKLKKLELIKVEGPGKLRLRAAWSAGRGVTRRGLVKVYGLNQLKGWAQEIVVLGMLRKAHNPSLLQCLWTANTNPYFETMTMLSGQIVTSEARLICLELTSSGNLQDFLSSLDVPLPEPCTRTILHDLAEGLAQLHSQNILHGNLTSATVYLKGSIQRLVLRAALGDFEEAQIYGTLQSGTISSPVSKKDFFLPDIRAFGLVALEILGFVCKRRQDEKQPHRLITSPRNKTSADLGDGNTDNYGRRADGKRQRKHGGAANTNNGMQFCAPGAADDTAARGGMKKKDHRNAGRTTAGTEKLIAKIPGGGGGRHHDRRGGAGSPPSDFADNDYMELGDYGDGDGDGDGDSGMTSLVGYYPDDRDDDSLGNPDDEDDPRLPPITHVREAYSYEFPNQSVFKAARGSADDDENDYEEIDDIEEQIHREIRYNAMHRRRDAAQTGGYIVTRTTSGRELFIPHNTSFGNSDSGYVGTSSNNSSRYPYSGVGGGGGVGVDGIGAGGMDDVPPDVSWPKAAHRTVSANTISSFGDDILEVLPGMTDEDDLKQGERSLRQMLRAREDAKVEQILEEYQQRVREGGFSAPAKEWPKLKFSRTMGAGNNVSGAVAAAAAAAAGVGMGVGEGPSGGGNRSRPSTPRTQPYPAPPQQDLSSPRPKTAAPGAGPTRTKRLDKARPLSASASSAGAWKLRSSFKKSKARNELARALSRGNSFAHGLAAKPERRGEVRGAGAKLIEQKYAAHNAAFKRDEDGVDKEGNDETVVAGGVVGEHGAEPPKAVEGSSYDRSVSVNPNPLLPTHDNPGLDSLPGKDSKGPNSQMTRQHEEHRHLQDKQQQQLHHHHVQHHSDGNDPRHHHSHHQQQLRHHQEPSELNNNNNITNDNARRLKETSSFSSQAEHGAATGRDPHTRPTSKPPPPPPPLPPPPLSRPAGVSQGTFPTGKKTKMAPPPPPPIIIPGMKFVDSGFDEDSASVVSDVSYQGDDRTAANASPSALAGRGGGGGGGAVVECRCSCPSGTGSAESDSCSCECSQCQYSHSGSLGNSPQHGSGWSESQSSVGTWSNSNSFSSYDVKMHRRKLPSEPAKNVAEEKEEKEEEEHVLGPDEQYPEHPSSSNKPDAPAAAPPPSSSSSSPGKANPQQQRHHRPHHHQPHPHKTHAAAPSHAGSSSSSSGGGNGSSSAPSRRYRELTKKGVPLRVSRVDDGDSPRGARERGGGGGVGAKRRGGSSFPGQDGATAEVIEEEAEDGLVDSSALFQDLESQGFFESTDSASSKSSPLRNKKRPTFNKRLEVVQGAGGGGGGGTHSHLPHHHSDISALEEIIKEIPDETGGRGGGGGGGGGSCNADETKAFLNRPESELSIKALKPPAPPPPVDHLPSSYGQDGITIADLHREPRVVHDAELVIDRIFSRAHPANTKGSEPFVDPSLGLDEAAIRELAMLPPLMEVADDSAGYDLGNGEGLGEALQVPLLRGTDSKHVHYVRRLSDKVDLLSTRELLPADQRSFEALRRRLQHTGSFGTIGLQLLDMVGACWVKENPPTTADIVDQLTDHVTETEL